MVFVRYQHKSMAADEKMVRYQHRSILIAKMLNPINGCIIQSILGVHASQGDFGVSRSILEKKGQFGTIVTSILGKCQCFSGKETIPKPCLVDFGQYWAIWDGLNVDFGQMPVLFGEGDNRCQID